MTTKTEDTRPRRGRRSRRAALALALWVFGLSTTLLLVGLWGRTVAGDRASLEASARAVLTSEVVAGRLTDWMAQGISDAGSHLPESGLADAADAVWSRPETQVVLADAVGRVVDAALAPPGESVPIDLGEVFRPVTPVVVDELAGRGLDIDGAIVDTALSALPTVVLDTEAELGIVAAVSEARAVLTRVVALAVAGMTLSAGAAIALSEERLRQMRGLAFRIAVSAVTFALLLRISAWALDPGKGRSPLAAGGSVLLSSGLHVLVITAGLAGGAALFAAVGVRRRRDPALPA